MSRHTAPRSAARHEHPLRRRRFVLGVAASSVLLLSACGSSSTKAATTTAAAAVTAAPAAAPTAAAATVAAVTTPAATSAAAAATTAAATTAAGGTAAAASGTPVAVTESEFKIEGISTTMTAGTYTFDIKNGGQFPHNLVVSGGDIANQKSATFTAGLSGSLTVTLKPGTYDFFCGIPTHKAKGMDLTVTVT